MTSKTIEEKFSDWEGSAFGFGYGSGEPHTLGALKAFMDNIGVEATTERGYSYERLESVLGPAVAWLLINALCRHPGIIEYGTSPRFGWLTKAGEALKAFVDAHTVEQLYEVCCGPQSDDYNPCYPDACNCGPEGYEEGRRCDNPFWAR